MLKNKSIKGYIYLKSGLHIGGNKDTMHIGGIDNPVIKNPITNLPYIPGSSLKGKMRFLLEHYYGLVKSGDIPGIKETGQTGWKENMIAKMFGHLEHKDTETHPTRVIFRDGNLIGAIGLGSPLSPEDINRDITGIERRINCEFVEAKTEVCIDRLKGSAKDKSLRTIERVPAGTVFDFEIGLKMFAGDDENLFVQILKEGLKLLENDALGGSGSRGSGRIRFFDLSCDGESFVLEDVKL